MGAAVCAKLDSRCRVAWTSSAPARHARCARRARGHPQNNMRVSPIALHGFAPCTSAARHAAITSAASPEDVQLAAALVTPLLAYKIAATVRGYSLMWTLDVAIALATFALLKFALG